MKAASPRRPKTPAPAPPPPAPGRRILPALNLAALALLVLLLAARRIGDLDLWWHLAAGRWMVENRAVPQVDMFSFTRAGAEWLDLHWLFQILAYLLHRFFSFPGLIALKLVCFGGAWGLAAWTIRPAKTPLTAVFFFALGTVAANIYFVERPTALTVLFLAFTFLVLVQWRRQPLPSRLIYALPLVQLLWTNCHSLFVLGLYLQGCFATEALADRLRRPQDAEHAARLKQIGLVLALSIAAGLVNPYGLRGLLFPWLLFQEVSGRAGDISLYTGEFRPTILEPTTSPHFLAWAALLPLSGLTFLLRGRRVSLARLLAWAGMAYLSWVALRNVIFLGLLAPPIAALNLGEWYAEREAWIARAVPAAIRRYGVAAGGAALLVAQLGLAQQTALGRFSPGWPVGWGVDWEQTPRGAAEFIAAEKIPGPGFNTFDDGGYLIWRLYPGYRVFMDGRNEVSGPEFFGRYLDLVREPRRFPELTAPWPLRYALVRHRNSFFLPLLSWFGQNPDYALVYLDSTAALFVKRAYDNAEWVRQHEIPLADLPSASPPAPGRPPSWTYRWLHPAVYPADALALARLYKWLQLPNRAMREYAAAAAQAPENAEAWTGIGSVLFAQRRLTDAVAYLSFGLRLDPRSANGHNLLARALETSEPEAALEHHLQAIRLLPRDHRLRNDLAVFYLRRRQFDLALEQIRLARRDPQAVDAPMLDLNEALIYLDQGNPAKARELLERYVAKTPDDVRSRFLYATLLWREGRYGEARQHFDYARQNNFAPPPGMAYPDQPSSP